MSSSRSGLVRLILILLVIWVALAGCGSDRTIDPNSNVQDNTEEAGDRSGGGLQTATPPAFPDLRGSEFSWVLFTLDRLEFRGLNQSIAAGVTDGVAHLNSQGGVNGAQVGLVQIAISSDSESPADQILAQIDDIKPLIVLMAAPIDETLYYELSQEDVPVLYFGLGDSPRGLTAQVGENIFWLVPPPDEQLAFFVAEVWKNWDRLRPSGNFNQVRLGYFGMDENYPLLQSNPDLETFLRQSNFDLTLRESINPTSNASAANFLVESISAGVTVLYADTTSPGTAVLLNDLNTLAVSEFFVVGGAAWSIDSSLGTYLLVAESIDGYLISLPIAWWSDGDNPAIQLARAIHAENQRPENQLDTGYLLGLGAADLGREALGAAIDRSGSANVKGEDVLEQLAVLEDYALMGGLYTLDYTAGNRSPTFLQLWQVSNSLDWVPLGTGGEIPDFTVDDD